MQDRDTQRIPTENNQDIQTTRRSMLKGIGLTGAMAVVPAAGTAAMINPEPEQKLPSSDVPHNGLWVEISDSVASEVDNDMIRVAISNNTEMSIELKNLSPGRVTIDDSVYDLNKRISQDSITIHPSGIYYLWLRPEADTDLVSETLKHPRDNVLVPVSIARGVSKSVVMRTTQHASAVPAHYPKTA